jgi:hypothetical protein
LRRGLRDGGSRDNRDAIPTLPASLPVSSYSLLIRCFPFAKNEQTTGLHRSPPTRKKSLTPRIGRGVSINHDQQPDPSRSGEPGYETPDACTGYRLACRNPWKNTSSRVGSSDSGNYLESPPHLIIPPKSATAAPRISASPTSLAACRRLNKLCRPSLN